MFTNRVVPQLSGIPERCPNGGSRYPFEDWDRDTDPALYINENIPKFRMRACRNADCTSTRGRLDRVAPRLEPNGCPGLRDWVLDVASCWIAQRQGLPDSARRFCSTFLGLYRHQLRSPVVTGPDTLRICNLFEWIAGLQTPWKGRVLDNILTQKILTSWVMREDVIDLPRGVCRYRFWNLALSTPRGIVETLSMKDKLNQMQLSKLHLDRHRDCTIQICFQNDENTTTVPQHHLCPDPEACDLTRFPIEQVNEINDQQDGATAWSLSEPHTVRSKPYMAISHVWSDGTGVGLKGPGNVNACLVEHFRSLAKHPEINCSGIWWDAICLPMEKEKRINALSKMHSNYQEAACTLVHDLELADFTWADDGSPCLALVFSTWFSRGWTALELLVSKNVWVVFKDSNGSPILKNLDMDILARDDDPFAHPTHKQISRVIHKLRPSHCSEFSLSTLDVLRSRYTCWPRDRSIVAGLMTAERLKDMNWFDSSWSQTRITQEILIKCQTLSHYALYHERVPICETGPWSWCPPQLLDMGLSRPHDPLDITKLEVDEYGRLQGNWIVISLMKRQEEHRKGSQQRDDQPKLRPFASHDVLAARITSALEHPDDCRLLNPYGRPFTSGDLHFPLVKMLDLNKAVPDATQAAKYSGKLVCGFVGIVVGNISKEYP